MDKVRILSIKGEVIPNYRIAKQEEEILSQTIYPENTNNKYKAVFFINLDNRFSYINAVKANVEREINAFFYQLERVKKLRSEKDKRYLSCIEPVDLVYVDFSSAISSRQDAVEEIFREGFLIKENDKVRHMVPFDKSASMSRKSTITFIDISLKDVMDMRLTLGIFEKDKKYPLSKVYAYRGLYISNGVRVDEIAPDADSGESFVLNEETVVVIPDVISRKRDYNVTVYTELYEENGNTIYGEKTYSKDDSGFEVNCFDGEGLIDKEFAALLAKRLKLSGLSWAEKATSFQIRLPYGKGMLHSVDFKAFCRDEFNIDKDKYILDYFGFKRRIRNIKIIMTTSMFKAHKWVREAFGAEGNDPMKTYFERFHKARHALYILRTDKSLFNPGYVGLNYQFLNTGLLTGDKFVRLIEDSFNNYTRPLEYDDNEKRKYLIGKNLYDGSEDNIDDDEPKKDDDDMTVLLRKHPELIRDKYFQNMISGVIKARYNDGIRGNLLLKGENRFLSGDLIYLLRDFALNTVVNEEKNLTLKNYDMNYRNKVSEGFYKKLLSQRLKNRFYAPENKNTGIRYDKERYYAILRNPHISRNEQFALKAYIPAKDDNLYKKYLGHLSGVICLPYGSPEAERLSGADFDGDMVKIYDNEVFNNSAEECYKNNSLVQIQHKGEPLKSIPEQISFEDIKDGFDNRVGQITNMAVNIGEVEYNENISNIKDEKKKDEATELKSKTKTDTIDYAAAGCILVGKEIDKAKTGENPDISQLIDMNNEIKLDFLKNKDKISNYRKASVEKKLDNEGRIASFEYKAPSKHSVKRPDVSDPNLERLWFTVLNYNESVKENTKKDTKINDTGEGNEVKKSSLYIPVKKDILDKELLRKLRVEMISYFQILKAASKKAETKRKYENTPYKRNINYITGLQYDKGRELIGELTVDEALQRLYVLVDKLAECDIEMVSDALDEVVNKKWYFTPQDEREAFLRVLFNYDKYGNSYNLDEYEKNFDIAKKLVSNFSSRGYYILYYVLKDVIANHMLSTDFEDIDFTAESEKLTVRKSRRGHDGKDEKSNVKKSNRIVELKTRHLVDIYKDRKNCSRLSKKASYICSLIVKYIKDKDKCGNAIRNLQKMTDDVKSVGSEFLHDEIFQMEREDCFDSEYLDEKADVSREELISILTIWEGLLREYSSVYDEYYNYYLKNNTEKSDVSEEGDYDEKILKRSLGKFSRNRINEIFKNIPDGQPNAVEYWNALKGYDDNRTFLWGVFKAAEIEKIIEENYEN